MFFGFVGFGTFWACRKTRLWAPRPSSQWRSDRSMFSRSARRATWREGLGVRSERWRLLMTVVFGEKQTFKKHNILKVWKVIKNGLIVETFFWEEPVSCFFSEVRFMCHFYSFVTSSWKAPRRSGGAVDENHSPLDLPLRIWFTPQLSWLQISNCTLILIYIYIYLYLYLYVYREIKT